MLSEFAFQSLSDLAIRSADLSTQTERRGCRSLDLITHRARRRDWQGSIRTGQGLRAHWDARAGDWTGCTWRHHCHSLRSALHLAQLGAGARARGKRDWNCWPCVSARSEREFSHSYSRTEADQRVCRFLHVPTRATELICGRQQEELQKPCMGSAV